jgi:hypothetical protein
LSYSNDNSGLELLSTITLPAVILSVEANEEHQSPPNTDTVAVSPRNINSANTTYGFGVNKHCFLNELGGHQSIIGLSTKPGLHWDHVNDVSIEQNPTSVGDFSCEPGLHWDHINDVLIEQNPTSVGDFSCELGLHWDHVNDVSIEQNPTSVGDFSCEPGLHWDHVNDVSTGPGRNSSSADDLLCEPGRGWTSIYAIPCERRQSWSFPVDD